MSICLITGATGFVGGHLAEAARTRGLAVRTLARAGSDTALLDRLGAEIAPRRFDRCGVGAQVRRGCRFGFPLRRQGR